MEASPSLPRLELQWPGKRARRPNPAPPELRLTDAFDGPSNNGASLFEAPQPGADFRNRLFWGDNLPVMEALLDEFRAKIDLIYLDPPFDARRDFSATTSLGDGTGMGDSRDAVVEDLVFHDTWGEGEDSYAQMLYERLGLVRELLAPTGSLIVHVNWRVSHVVQLLLDEVFGPGERQSPGAEGFRCEIVWGFGGGSAVKNVYRRKHDNLFWYTRSREWTFNPQYRPYSEGTLSRGLTAVKGPQYELRAEGAALETWWTDADVQKILSPSAHENLKFPTQKPERLLERIIRGHSNANDLVADFFCGSGTTGAVAERLGRRWLMADSSRIALLTTRKRLARAQETQAAADAPFRAFDVYETVPG